MGETVQQGNILLVDDDRDVLLSAELLLKNQFSKVTALSNPIEIKEILKKENIDVVLLDMNFTRGFTSGEEGIYWLKQVKEHSPHTQIIVATAYGDIDLAVEAIKQGASDFLVKPWNNEKLISTVNTSLQLSHSQQRIDQLESTQRTLNDTLQSKFGEIIGESFQLKELSSLIDKVAGTDASVLILGENGTGKELVARAIHQKSLRNNSPLITVDLGAITESLFETEMFGHKKGAFTGASVNRAGRFEAANGGTLFLDEIGNLNLNLQAKLLGVLQSGSVTRVGSDRTTPIDIRLISATNMAVEEINDATLFRRDLLYRINTVEIRLPPLRERKSDIALLARHYIKLYAKKYNKPELHIRAEELRNLENYHWPGNIRELQHALERAVIIGDSESLNSSDILTGKAGQSRQDQELNISKLEKEAIKRAITQFEGNLSRVAKALGVGRTTLYRKMEKYGISI